MMLHFSNQLRWRNLWSPSYILAFAMRLISWTFATKKRWSRKKCSLYWCPIHGNEQTLPRWKCYSSSSCLCCPKTFPVVSKEKEISSLPFVSQQKFSLYKVSDEKIGRKDAQHEVSSSITCDYHDVTFTIPTLILYTRSIF